MCVNVCICCARAQAQGLGILGKALYHCVALLALGCFETGFHDAQAGLEFLSAGVAGVYPNDQPEYVIACPNFRILNAECLLISCCITCQWTIRDLSQCLAIPWLLNVLRNVRDEDMAKKPGKYKNAIGCIRESM